MSQRGMTHVGGSVRMLAALAALGATLVSGLVGCGGEAGRAASASATIPRSTTSEARPRPSAPYPLQTIERTFVDSSRPTAAGAVTPAATTRTLRTVITYPDVSGPLPLIVLSHGLGGLPEQLSKLASAWAAAGFVVARPAFPLTDARNHGRNAGDVVNQPKDVSFVIDRMLAENATSGSPVHGRIDPTHIGVAGHSLGGATTYGVTFAPCCRDQRITATIILSGLRLIDAGKEEFDHAVPILVIHGTQDVTLNYQLDVDAYAALHAPKWFITLLGAGHSPPYVDADSPWDDLVTRSTIDFWQAELGGDRSKLTQLQTDAVVDNLSTLQSVPG